MIELTQRQEQKILAFANKGYTKLSELADNAREATSRKEEVRIVNSGLKLAIFLGILDDKRTTWSTVFTMKAVDRLINEFNLFQIPVNTAQLDFNAVGTRVIGENDGISTGDFATNTQLNSEASARIAQDSTLQDNIDATNNRIDNLDFTGLVPATVVFSEETAGYKDFPTELDNNLPNKSTLDALTAQDLTDIDLANQHRGNNDIHVTASQKNDWDNKVTPAQLATGLSGKANTNHTHTIGQISGLQSELDTLAQDIIDNAAEDGVTPSISVGSVTSGTPASVSLNPASTVENPILDFILEAGEKGDQGDPFEFGVIDFLANRSNYINEPFGFSFVDVQTGLVYYKQAGAGTDSWSGGIRTIGDRGWTPVHVLEPINGKAYLKLVDYVDGQGVKPTQNIGSYVGPTGYVVSPLAATNLKGNQGPSPVAGVDYDIPRFKIDTTLTYSQYLAQAATLLSNQALGYTIKIEDSVSPYENKNGIIIQLSRNNTSGAREWKEFGFEGEQGPAGVPGPQGPAGSGGDLSSTDIDSITKLNAIVGTNIIFQDGNSISLGLNATTFNNTIGKVRQVVSISISNVNHTINFSSSVSPGSLYRFFVTKTTASDVTLNINRTFQTTTYLNSNILKGDNNSVHLVEVHGANGLSVSTTPLVSGGGGIDPSKIVNNFSTDPNDATKVAGADAVYQLFQILASNDVDYDTLQEIVDFIKTIDTDGELVAAIDTAVGNAEWRVKYTDAQAIQAQELQKRSGTSIEFDAPACYGYNPSAETGNITFDFTDAIAGMTQILRHNSGTKPTMPASANKLSGDYVVSVDNIIYLTPILLSTSPDVWEVQVTVSQDNTW